MAFRRGSGRSTRRSGGSGWRRAPALPTRRTARKIVKRAGPLESAFWLDSTQANYGDSPGQLYAAGEQFYDQRVFQLFGPNDYTQDTGNRERVLIRRFEFRSTFVPPKNFTEGAHPLQSNELGFMLVRGPATVLSNYFEAGFGDANPWGSAGSVTAYEQLPREVKVLARKIRIFPAGINMISSAQGGVLPGEDPADIYMGALQGRPWLAAMTLRFKMKWIQEPESIWAVSYRLCTKQSAQPAEEIGRWEGEHRCQVSYARY